MPSRKSIRPILLLLVLLLICADNLGPGREIPSSGASGTGKKHGLTFVSHSIFTWRNYFKSSPAIEQQADAPLVIRNPRFYSNWSWRHGISATIDHDVVNVSQKPIHSFTTSHRSTEPWDTGASGSQPGSALKPGDSMSMKVSMSGKSKIALTVDFVQFADGTTWYSTDGQKFVHRDGVRAGAREAAEHLIRVLESSGPEAVLKALPRIHADVHDRLSTIKTWGFGHYCGVTNVSVKVQHANQEGGLSAIEGALRRILEDPAESDR